MAPAESGDCLFTHSNSDPCPRQALLSRLSQSACSHHQKNRPLRQLHAVLRRHLQQRLESGHYLMGADYTIADIATWPWVRTLGGFYDAHEALGLDDFPTVNVWLATCADRPASKSAINIPPRG